jgi:hypothetical protein
MLNAVLDAAPCSFCRFPAISPAAGYSFTVLAVVGCSFPRLTRCTA